MQHYNMYVRKVIEECHVINMEGKRRKDEREIVERTKRKQKPLDGKGRKWIEGG